MRMNLLTGRHLPAVVTTLTLVAVPAVAADKDKPAAPPARTAASPLPQAFDALVVTGAQAGKFACIPCAHGLHPFTLVFLRDADAADPAVIDLLKRLQGLAGAHPDAQYGAAVIVLGDGGYRKALLDGNDEHGTELLQALDTLKDLQDKLSGLAQSAGLKTVQTALVDPATPGLAAYQIPANAPVAIFTFDRAQPAGQPAFFDKAPTKEQLAKIVKDVEAIVLKEEKFNRAGE